MSKAPTARLPRLMHYDDILFLCFEVSLRFELSVAISTDSLIDVMCYPKSRR